MRDTHVVGSAASYIFAASKKGVTRSVRRMTMYREGGGTITSRHNSQAAVNYRVRSALVPAVFGESLVAARNFRRNKETHIWRFHYRAQLFQGRGALNKFIRHLTVIKDTRHAEAPVIAIVLSSPLNGYARIVFIISRRRSGRKEGEK